MKGLVIIPCPNCEAPQTFARGSVGTYPQAECSNCGEALILEPTDRGTAIYNRAEFESRFVVDWKTGSVRKRAQ